MTVTARRVYSAQELRRLRDSSSEPKLREAIEQHDGVDAEVVKGTSESGAAHTHSRAHLKANFDLFCTILTITDRACPPRIQVIRSTFLSLPQLWK
jgi:hypothetical protein